MKPLAIGIVCYPSLGGSGVIASELAVGMAERGHAVHLIATARPPRAREVERLTFHRVTVPEHPLLEHAPYSLALANAIVEVARAHPLDVLEVHFAVPHAESAYLARQTLGPGAPRVATALHGTDVTQLGADPALRRVVAFTVSASDGVTVPSAWLAGEARRALLSGDVPIEVMPNFVDVERFRPAVARHGGPGPVLFHVSSLRPVKRVTDLAEVLARVRRTVPARLVVVGDGPDRPALEQRARELGVADALELLGRRADFADRLRLADAFVLPSAVESFGVAALEALSSGVPVFGYRVGGLPDVVAEGTGRLVEPYAVEALADAIVEVVTRPEARDALGRAARAHVLARFAREAALSRYEAWFRGLCRR